MTRAGASIERRTNAAFGVIAAILLAILPARAVRAASGSGAAADAAWAEAASDAASASNAPSKTASTNPAHAVAVTSTPPASAPSTATPPAPAVPETTRMENTAGATNLSKNSSSGGNVAPNGSGTVYVPVAAGSQPIAASQVETGAADPDSPLGGNNDIQQYMEEQTASTGHQFAPSPYFGPQAVESPIGVGLREDERVLKSGRQVSGLLIVSIQPGSPAEHAGLHTYHHTVHDIMMGATMVGAMVMPPAMILAPLIELSSVGKSYDMIIGVDGVRVTNLLQFDDVMQNLKPGEIVYLTVIRDGERKQIQVPIPKGFSLATSP